MTRGTFIYIANENGDTYISDELNGDMYLENPGYGREAIEILKPIKSAEDFESVIMNFNNTHHKYENFEIYKENNILDGFEKNNYSNWNYSDYLYIKNGTDKDFLTKDYDGKPLNIPADKVTVLYFGSLLNV